MSNNPEVLKANASFIILKRSECLTQLSASDYKVEFSLKNANIFGINIQEYMNW